MRRKILGMARDPAGSFFRARKGRIIRASPLKEMNDGMNQVPTICPAFRRYMDYVVTKSMYITSLLDKSRTRPDRCFLARR